MGQPFCFLFKASLWVKPWIKKSHSNRSDFNWNTNKTLSNWIKQSLCQHNYLFIINMLRIKCRFSIPEIGKKIRNIYIGSARLKLKCIRKHLISYICAIQISWLCYVNIFICLSFSLLSWFHLPSSKIYPLNRSVPIYHG